MGLFSFGSSESSSRSRSDSSAESFISALQSPFLRELFAANSGVLGETASKAPGVAADLSADLGSSGNVFLDLIASLGAGGGGAGLETSIGSLTGAASNPIAEQLMQRLNGARGGSATLNDIAGGVGPGGPLAGTDALTDIAGGGGGIQELLGESPALAGSLSLLDEVIQNNLASTTGTIAGQATLQGATGGSRQALATGIAGEEAVRSFAGGANELIGRDFERRTALAPAALNARLQAATALQGGDATSRGLDITSRGLQLSAADSLNAGEKADISGLLDLLATELGAVGEGGSLALGEGGLRLTAGSSGIDSLGSLFDLGIGQFSGSFAPLLAAAAVLGNPAILNKATSSSRGKSSSSSINFGFGSND